MVTPSVGGTSLGSHRLTRDRPGGLLKGKFGLCAAGSWPASGKWFVGRVSELAAIGACVDAVSGGAGRVVWVEGDPGSGKTALVNHVVAELPAAFVVLRAAADESAADQPFAVLEQFGIEGGGSPQAVGLDLVALLTEAGGGGPVAVVVEDLHWADRESRQALLAVVRRVGEERVLLLVTSRPGAAPDGWERLSAGSVW